MLKVLPSLLAADPLNLERDAERMISAGCDALHVDVMDAHFVPNLAFSPAMVRSLTGRFRIPADVHLMMDEPGKYLDAFLDAGASFLTIHAEANGDLKELLGKIRDRGVKAGIALKPATSAASIGDLLPSADMVLVMTVEPGFGGQSFRPEMMEKLIELRKMGYTGLLEADGGLNAGNLQALVGNGLDMAVMGTSLFRETDPAETIRKAHELTKQTDRKMICMNEGSEYE